VLLPVEAWMDLRRYKPLREAGATWREIADEVGLDWRAVKRYLSTQFASMSVSVSVSVQCRSRPSIMAATSEDEQLLSWE
jgi:hypothetical protein